MNRHPIDSPRRAPRVLYGVVAAASLAGCARSHDDVEEVGAGAAALAGEVCLTLQRGVSGDVADAYLDTLAPAVNQGASASLYTGRTAPPPGTRVTLLRFDVGGVPPGSSVTHAVVTLQETAATALGVVTVRGVTTPWQESTVRLSNFATSTTSAPLANFSNGGAGFVGPRQFDLTATVQSWLDGAPNDGLMLTQSGSGSSTFAASESADQAARPRLEVCYVPPPTCSDGLQNQGEAGVDCGGPCPACDPCAEVVCAAADACHLAGSCDPATGACSDPAGPPGAPCSEGGGAVCDGAGQCVACLGNADCGAGKLCSAGHACELPVLVGAIGTMGSAGPSNGIRLVEDGFEGNVVCNNQLCVSGGITP